VSWDVQADIEQALLNGDPFAVCLMDYYKYFDSMEPIFMAQFAKAIGICADQVDMTTELYSKISRYVKIGQTLGKPFSSDNGFGQGDSYSLMIALTLVSIQFEYIQDKHQSLRMGSCVDDRNIRGDPTAIVAAFRDMSIFDKMTGHFNNPKKVAVTATTRVTRDALATANVGTEEEVVHSRVYTVETLVVGFCNCQEMSC